MDELTGGRSIVDLRADGGREGPDRGAARVRASPLPLRGRRRAVHDVDSERPRITFTHEGGHELDCDVIAGCDGFHGVCRASDPRGAPARVRARVPVRLARHPRRGRAVERRARLRAPRARLRAALAALAAALALLRAGRGTTRTSRDWPDERIWDGAAAAHGARRLDARTTGRSSRRASPGCAASSREPMQHGRLFLAGDAAHIVPPTGAKGLNLAIHDVRLLAEALVDCYRARRPLGARRLLRRVPAAGLALPSTSRGG